MPDTNNPNENTTFGGGFLDDFINMASGKVSNNSIWREHPVDLMTYFTSEKFLNERPYPGKQTELIDIVNKILWWKFTRDEKLCPQDLREVTELVVMFGKGCKHGDTRIYNTDTGIMHTFKELSVQSKEFGTKSFDEDDNKIKDSRTTGVVRAGKGSIYEIVTDAGRRTKVFDEHLFLTNRDNNIDWVKVKDILVGDYIAVPATQITEKGISEESDIIRFIGYLVGLTNSYKNFQHITPKKYFHNQEDEINKFTNNYIKTLQSKLRKLKLNTYKNNKRLPKDIFNLNKQGICDFISGLFVFGSFISLENDSPKIKYYNVHTSFLEDLQFLLSKIGIYSKIAKSEQIHKLHYLLIEDNAFKVFCENIKIENQENLQSNIYAKIKDKIYKNSDIIFEKIVQINYVNEDFYYDLTVEDYANYSSDGFLDHNSGKDFLVSCFLSYICYLLCCMKNPQEYFGFGSDEPIDIINVAINAKQATGVFFKKLKARFSNCSWFKKVGYNPSETETSSPNDFQFTKDQIRLYKNITCHSAHSEADSYEGFNPLVVILDEIGGFERDKAEDCYKTLRSSAVTRYGSKAFLIFISFPRAMDDYMMVKYREATENKDPQVYSIIGKSWEINPKMTRESLEKDYLTDPEGSKMRYECLPPAYSDGLFSFPEKIDDCVMVGVQSQCPGLIVQEKITTRRLHTGMEKHFIGLELFNLELNPEYTYYLGGDGGVTSDSYCLALFHAEPTLIQTVENGKQINKYFNKPVEDLILEWKPSKKDRLPVDLMNVADVIEQICRQVFVKKALFDKFNSAEVVQRLMAYGVDAEDKNWSNPFQLQIYNNFKALIYTGQVSLLDYQSRYENVLSPNEELKAMKIINGSKIDHDKDKCLLGDTQVNVLLNNKEIKTVNIKDLIGLKNIKILSVNTESKQVEYKEVLNPRITKYISEYYEIETEDGGIIKCTGNHPILCKGMIYKRAEDITESDEIIKITDAKILTTVKVKSIKKIKLEEDVPVYDIEVVDNNNFELANGLVVHNSKDFSDSRTAAVWLCSMDEVESQDHFSLPTIMGARRKK